MKTKITDLLGSLRKPVLLTVSLLVICGLLYPLLLTGFSQLLFPHQANGSLVYAGGQAVGSQLIGQDFSDERFMKCRPSAVAYNTYTQDDVDSGEYSGVASGSDNYATTNPDLVDRVEDDIESFLKANPSVRKEDIPTDLLTASGSGLDPHISPASAAVQIPALAETTGLSQEKLEEIVRENTQGKLLGIFGEETVNVLTVNLGIAQELGIIGHTIDSE